MVSRRLAQIASPHRWPAGIIIISPPYWNKRGLKIISTRTRGLARCLEDCAFLLYFQRLSALRDHWRVVPAA